MGFYFRKSIRVGPLRFNLSKGGIGVSAGIPGFRVGTGPRGNYVQMGARGIYYRTTLPSGRSAHSVVPPLPPRSRGERRPGLPPSMPPIPADSAGPMVEIESAHVSQLVDTSSADLLNELQRKKKRPRYAIAVGAVGAVATLLGFINTSGVWPFLILFASIGVWGYVHLRDVLARTTVLFYEFDHALGRAFEGLQSAGKHLQGARGFWHVQAQAKVNDGRYHAGASGLNELGTSAVSFAAPTFLRTNVEVFNIPVGRQVLHFFPDRVLIEDPAGIGAVSYRDLSVEVIPTRFIEERPVPSDTEVVGQTWRYVNRNGSPDRRFKNNRMIPICQYAYIQFSSPSGLNERVMVSRPGVAQFFHDHLNSMRVRTPAEGVARVVDRTPS